VLIWLERFVLGGVCVAAFVYVVFYDGMKLDWLRRASLGGAILLFALFIGLTIEKKRQAGAESAPQTVADELVVAGVVVDASSSAVLAQAMVSVVGRSENDVTDDNGNFRLMLRGTNANSLEVRLRVAKGGFEDSDNKITAPVGDLVIQLRRK